MYIERGEPHFISVTHILVLSAMFKYYFLDNVNGNIVPKWKRKFYDDTNGELENRNYGKKLSRLSYFDISVEENSIECNTRVLGYN